MNRRILAALSLLLLLGVPVAQAYAESSYIGGWLLVNSIPISTSHAADAQNGRFRQTFVADAMSLQIVETRTSTASVLVTANRADSGDDGKVAQDLADQMLIVDSGKARDAWKGRKTVWDSAPVESPDTEIDHIFIASYSSVNVLFAGNKSTGTCDTISAWAGVCGTDDEKGYSSRGFHADTWDIGGALHYEIGEVRFSHSIGTRESAFSRSLVGTIDSMASRRAIGSSIAWGNLLVGVEIRDIDLNVNGSDTALTGNEGALKVQYSFESAEICATATHTRWREGTMLSGLERTDTQSFEIGTAWHLLPYTSLTALAQYRQGGLPDASNDTFNVAVGTKVRF